MDAESDDRAEEIKKWFIEIVDGGTPTTVDHVMKKIECRQEMHRKQRESTPLWTYLFREDWQKKEGHSTISGWLRGHKFICERNYKSETLRSMGEFYFPDCKVEDDEILFEGLIEREGRQLGGNFQDIDNQKPSTSTSCQELSNVITIDDDELIWREYEMKQKTDNHISTESNDFDVFTLDELTQYGRKRTASKSKASPVKKKMKRRPEKCVHTIN